jgi:hypothetical protein
VRHTRSARWPPRKNLKTALKDLGQIPELGCSSKDWTMASRAIQWVLVIVAIGIGSVDATRVRAEGDDPAALAAALKDTTATLQGGLKASEREGTPISAKFEIGDGKPRL